jgi:hypothetical protein
VHRDESIKGAFAGRNVTLGLVLLGKRKGEKEAVD